MDLKNAAAVCLISLFSATLVVLIARMLDSQSAARLEPHLMSIAEDLRALRKQGGLAPAASSAPSSVQAEAGDSLVVYYFHGNTRCPTCESIESQALNAVKSEFAPQLASGQIVWKVLNYEQPVAATLKNKFEVEIPVVVLAKTAGGEIGDWKRLDEVWPLESDKPAFRRFMRDEVQAMLAPEKKKEPAVALPDGDISLFPKRKPGAPAPTVKTDALPLPIPKSEVLVVPKPKTDSPPVPSPKADLPKREGAPKTSDLPIP